VTPQQVRHARIMVECGCTIEDAAVTLRLSFVQAVHAVAPSLHANPAEKKRVRKMLAAGTIARLSTRAALGLSDVNSLNNSTKVAA